MAASYHAEDVGKILMAVQADLKALRADLQTTADAAVDPAKKIAALQHIVEKAETDVRLKTEAVLHNALNDQYTTLPAIRGSKRRASTPVQQRLTVKDEMNAKKQMELLLKPTSSEARSFIQDRFGVTAPPPDKPKLAQKVRGVLMKRKTNSPGTILPASNRNDPAAPPPKLTQKDVQRGMSELVNRGLVPKWVDLTPAFVKTPAPVLCGQVQLHNWEEQFIRHEPYTNALGFNLSGVKMDLISRAEPMDMAAKPLTTASMRYAPDGARASPRAGVEPIKPRTVPISVVAAGADLPAVQGGRDGGEVDSPRDYNELLDEFSLHQFIIRRGETLHSTPEFESFRRKHHGAWGAIQDVISGLERLLAKYNVPVAYVDGNKIALLSQQEYRKPTVDDYLDCLVNLDQVLDLIRVPGRKYMGGHRERNAALSVQAVYRGHLCRRGFRNALLRYKAAMVIQRHWKTVLASRLTARVVEEVAAGRRAKFAELSARLARTWGELQRRRRVVVHVPSITREEAQRMSMDFFTIQENSQLGRLMWVGSPDVEVVYVSPFPLSADVVQYYSKLLQIKGLERPEERFKLVHPENYDRFPSHLPLSSLLLYSPRCLKRIANFCRGKDAYIVPGLVGPDDVKLACALSLPLLAPDPQMAAVYGSKSGAKRIFALAEVNTPPGAYDLYSEHETMHSLARLIFERLDVHRWLFKIDDEFAGRGHAWIDTPSLPCHSALLREKERSMQLWLEPAKQQAAVGKVLEELLRLVPKRAQMAHKELYPTWEAFLDTFCRVGGVIEAVPGAACDAPSANLLVEPGGDVILHSTHDHIWTADYRHVGAACPQRTAPHAALRAAALAVGRACAEKGIVGYVGVDFVSFRDADGSPRLWAVDLNVGMSNTVVSFEVFRFICGGHFNPADGNFYAEVGEGGGHPAVTPADATADQDDDDPDDSRRGYVVCEPVFHPNIATVQYNVFFNLCRLKGIQFDLEAKAGTAFLMVDSFASGVIGLLCVGRNAPSYLRLLANALDFFQLQLGINRSHSDKFIPDGSFKLAYREVRQRLEAANRAKESRDAIRALDATYQAGNPRPPLAQPPAAAAAGPVTTGFFNR